MHTTFELLTCIFRTVGVSLGISGYFKHYGDSGPAGVALCILFQGSAIAKSTFHAATTSVVIHTLDHFWKIVYPIHHRKYYHHWMLYVALFLPWLNGFASNMMPAIFTTRIIKGICYPMTFWLTAHMEKVCWSSLGT